MGLGGDAFGWVGDTLALDGVFDLGARTATLVLAGVAVDVG